MQPVNSFDVFDTLIAHRCVDPRRVLDELENRAGLPGLAEARLAVDRTLGALGRPYQLRDMWQEVVRTTGIDAVTAERLMALEVQIEHEQVMPVVENLALVRDGVLLSDSYLPPDVILSLLHKAGMNRVVTLVASNDGKFSGRLWQQLLDKVSIREHLGDNPHSDGRMPSETGIRAVIYTGAAISPAERMLIGAGWESLALLVREVRLANPFSLSQPRQRQLWNLCCQFNFPLLYFASLWLEKSARQCGASELFFVSRDCLMWRSLFERLFPHRRSTYLFASRLCALKPSVSYLEYFRSTWTWRTSRKAGLQGAHRARHPDGRRRGRGDDPCSHPHWQLTIVLRGKMLIIPTGSNELWESWVNEEGIVTNLSRPFVE